MKKQEHILHIVGVIIVILINLIFYKQLPEEIAIQFSIDGDVNNAIPKMYFLFLAPIILLVNYLFSRLSDSNNLKKSLIVSGIIILINLVIILISI